MGKGEAFSHFFTLHFYFFTGRAYGATNPGSLKNVFLNETSGNTFFFMGLTAAAPL